MARKTFTPLFMVRVYQLLGAISILIISGIILNDIENYSRESYFKTNYGLRTSPKYFDAIATFVSAWTIIVTSLFIFIPIYYTPLANPLLFFGLEVLTNFLWIAAWVYLTVGYTSRRYRCKVNTCRLIMVDAIVSAIYWLSFVFSTGIMISSAIEYYKVQGESASFRCSSGGHFPEVRNEQKSLKGDSSPKTLKKPTSEIYSVEERKSYEDTKGLREAY